MKRLVRCTVVVFLIAASAQAAVFRQTRPFEGANLVRSSIAGIRTDGEFDRSRGFILLERSGFPIETHFDGVWNVLLAALDGSQISKKGQLEIVARDVSGLEIRRFRATATRVTKVGLGLRDADDSVAALEFQFKSKTFRIPGGGSLDIFFRSRRGTTGPGRFLYQATLVDDDGDSDSD